MFHHGQYLSLTDVMMSLSVDEKAITMPGIAVYRKTAE